MAALSDCEEVVKEFDKSFEISFKNDGGINSSIFSFTICAVKENKKYCSYPFFIDSKKFTKMSKDEVKEFLLPILKFFVGKF